MGLGRSRYIVTIAPGRAVIFFRESLFLCLGTIADLCPYFLDGASFLASVDISPKEYCGFPSMDLWN